MPTPNLPPSAGGEASGTIGRTENLEKRTGRTPAVRFPPVVFSYPGSLFADVESPPWYPESPVSVVQVRVSVTEAAAGDNSIDVLVGGSTIQSFTLTAGNTTDVFAAAIPVLPGVALTVKTTEASGENLSVIMRMKHR